MTDQCAKGFPSLSVDDVDPVDAAEVEQIWATPLPRDAVLVGGVDQRGWARACRVPDDPQGALEGEYRDRNVWYRGRFALRAEDGGDMPPDVLGTHYLSHFEPGLGLILMPLGDPEPPVRRMVLAPQDPQGYAIRPAD
ncbi:MAG: hypothetical protein AAFZ99_04550 [Pseudomonadota bacterium]